MPIIKNKPPDDTFAFVLCKECKGNYERSGYAVTFDCMVCNQECYICHKNTELSYVVTRIDNVTNVGNNNPTLENIQGGTSA